MKLIKLEIKGFKGVAKAELDLGDVNTVAGSNGSGKSSVIDAIAVALGGASGMPDLPVKAGEQSAEIVAYLNDGMVIRRKIMPDRRMALAVELPNKARPPKPQEFLDGLVGSGLALDPLEFIQSKPKDQANTLRAMVGLDTGDLDAQHAATYSERTLVGRQRDMAKGHAESLVLHAGVADTEQSSADLLATLNDAYKAKADRDAMFRQASELEDTAAKHAAEADECEKTAAEHPALVDAWIADANADFDKSEVEIREAIAALTKKLEGLEVKRQEHIAKIKADGEERIADLRMNVDKSRYRANECTADADLLRGSANSKAIPDVEQLQADLANVEGYNRKVADNRRRREAQAAADGLADQYKALTAKLDDLTAQKAARVAAVKWPVDGLGFSDDGTVTFRGVPLAQASQAEQLRTAMAIGLAMAGQIKMILLREASLLDDDSRKMVCDMAKEAGAQIVLEIVGAPADDDGNCFLMVDGEVAYATTAE